MSWQSAYPVNMTFRFIWETTWKKIWLSAYHFAMKRLSEPFIGEANRFLSAWMERKGFRNIAQFKGKLNIKDVQGNLAENLLAEDGSVGIRVTAEEFSKQLCFRFRKAIVSTSANTLNHSF